MRTWRSGKQISRRTVVIRVDDAGLIETVEDVMQRFHDDYHDGDGPVTEIDGETGRAPELCLKTWTSSVDGREKAAVCLVYGAHVLLDLLAAHGVRVHEVNPETDCGKPGHVMTAYLGWMEDTTFVEYSDEPGEDSG